MRAAMADPGFDLRATAPMLEAGPALEKCALPDEAWMTGRNAGSVAFQARMGCRGMLVIADTWYPGWCVCVGGGGGWWGVGCRSRGGGARGRRVFLFFPPFFVPRVGMPPLTAIQRRSISLT